MRQPVVFVVDDEDQIRGLLARILTRDGMRVATFGTADEALATLGSAGSDRPDVLVTDLTMPGMNGLELAARARALVPDVSVIVITGYASLENVVDALRTGVDDFVTKPFGASEFRTVVARVLERRTLAAGGATTAATASAPTTQETSAAAGPAPPAPSDAAPSAASIAESVRALLAEDVLSRDLVRRAMPLLGQALGATRAALLLPVTTGDGGWRIVASGGGSATAPGTSPTIPPHAGLAAAAGAADARALPAGPAGPLGAWTGTGPAAAVAVAASSERTGEGDGVLVVARPASGAPFAGGDLRVLEAAAGALGDVLRAVRTAERVEEAYTASLMDVVAATEGRSPWFREHSRRVRDVALAIGRRAGLDDDDLEILEVAAGLLDLGRVGIPDGLLDKPGRLSPDEWRAVRDHCADAERIVRPLGRMRHVQPVVRHHHENWDGTGYPDGLRGEAIPFLAAVTRIADAYAALVEPRPWRAPFGRDDAVRRVVEGSGTLFHPELVATFAELAADELPAAAPPRGTSP